VKHQRISSRTAARSLVNIFGDQKRVKARLKALSLVEHKIILEPID
jgi:predicted RNA-binding protein